jgi:hypothetical protein
MFNVLSVLALLLATVPAAAQIRLDPAEVATASVQCAANVTTQCLFTLALDALASQTTGPKNPWAISYIAKAQARAGDIVGATRTLTFGPATPEVFLAMGQWDAAYALAQKGFPNTIVEFGTAEGSFRIQMVQSQLEQNQLDLALRTAASITYPDEHDKALQIIINTLPPADGIALADQMQSVAGELFGQPARDRALLRITRTQIQQDDLAGAEATTQTIADPNILCEALTALAAVQPADAASQTLAAATRTVDQPRDMLFDGLRPVTCLLGISNLSRRSGNLTQAVSSARTAIAYMQGLPRQFGPNALLDAQTRVATALALAGDKEGVQLLNLPIPTELRTDERQQLIMARYVAFTSLGDPKAADELHKYLALVNTNPTDNQSLRHAALELVSEGLLSQALDLAKVIDTLPFSGGQSYDVYMAVANADAIVAMTALPDIKTDYIHVGMAASIARTLLDNSDDAKAGMLLADTTSWLLAAPDTDSPFGDQKVTLLAEIATSQTALGFPDDARATLQTAFAEYKKIDRTQFRISALLAIATALTK